MSHITLDGTQYVVSKEFAAHIEAALGTLDFDIKWVPPNIVETEDGPVGTPGHWVGAVERRIQTLMYASNGRSLTTYQRERLDALTHVKNVANAIRVVGAHHAPVKEWGLDGWDAVHGNAHHQPCGCIKHTVFDHHSATNHFGHNRVSADRKHYYIETRVCETHKVG